MAEKHSRSTYGVEQYTAQTFVSLLTSILRVMPKRKSAINQVERLGNSKKPRTRRFSRTSRKDPPLFECVDDLRRLVTFQKHNPNSQSDLQEFIDIVEFGAEENSKSTVSNQSRIVLDFAKNLTLEAEQDNSIGLTETWIHAIQTENDDLFVLVLGAFAALVKLFASGSELEMYGVRLCNTLLRHVKLFNYGCHKDSEHLKCVSSSLLLLKRLISFGDGVCAEQVYAQKPLAFGKLDMFLESRQTSLYETESLGRMTIRSVAIQFFIANLHFQRAGIKIAILSLPRLTKTLFNTIHEDEPEIVVDLCQTLLGDIVMADEIPRHIKGYIFTESTLVCLLDLSRLSSPNNQPLSLEVAEASHRLLVSICSLENGGVLCRRRGRYSSTEAEDVERASSDDERMPVSIILPSSTTVQGSPIKNRVLRAFLQILKPYKTKRECELAIAIFKAAPELVADYFQRKKNLPVNPELSADYIGCNAFLYATIALPIPEEYLGFARTEGRSPPVANILESILPYMIHKTITKGLNHDNRLIKMMSLKIIRVAFLKLGRLIHFITSKLTSWTVILPALIEQFSQRCPDLKYLFSVFRKSPADDRIRREMVTGVITKYFDYTPQLAIYGVLDQLNPFGNILEFQEFTDIRELLLGISKVENLNIIKILCFSPQVRWWHRPNGLGLSPFILMLRLYVQKISGESRNLKILLQSMLHDYSILQQSAEEPSLAALEASLSKIEIRDVSFDTWSFVDGCISRLIRKPAKYFGDLEELALKASKGVNSSEYNVSLLAIVVAEQFHFLSQSLGSDPSPVQDWVQSYLAACRIAGEDVAILGEINKYILNGGSSSNTILANCDELASRISQKVPKADKRGPGIPMTNCKPELWEGSLEDAFRPPPEPSNHNSLYRWEKKELYDAVQDRSVSELFMCLSSSIEDIRRQAILKIRLLVSTIEGSAYQASRQLLLLSGSLLETIAEVETPRPPPTIVTALAARSVLVLHDPLHELYSKVNTWLQRGPTWNWKKIPSQWIQLVLSQESELSERSWKDIEWVLDTLFEGLRTSVDMDLYCSCQVFERLFSLSFGAKYQKQLNEKVLRLVFRATFVEGGATLVTRCGAMGWIRCQLFDECNNHTTLKCLRQRLLQTCGEVVSGVWFGSHKVMKRPS